MQQLIYATREDPLTRQVTENVGLMQPLESPYNLFLNLEQLFSPLTRQVYFFIYSFGARKIILWGTYDKSTHEFRVDSACRYRGAQLEEITRYWTQHGYTHIGNITVDRITDAMLNYIEGKQIQATDYIQKRYLLAYLKEDISEEEYRLRYGDLPPLPEDWYDRLEYTVNLEGELLNYEHLNPQAYSLTSGEPFSAFARSQRISYSEYVQRKYLLAYLRGRISEADYEERYGSLPKLPHDLMQYIEALEEELHKYEQTINRVDLSPNLPRNLRGEVIFITNLFKEAVGRGAINTPEYEASLDYCPTLEDCELAPYGECNVYFHAEPEVR